LITTNANITNDDISIKMNLKNTKEENKTKKKVSISHHKQAITKATENTENL
jgi:hypothetical protein